ncbi:hypothetical protein [Streptomyces sp. NPDC004629]|uniref:hypothetical protein n=1 Tax=Streptomyces sp. NPDC004629 TaxID=3364705 RepID=UPI0036A5DEEA
MIMEGCPEVVELLRELVEIDSVNPDLAPDGGGETAIARHIHDWAVAQLVGSVGSHRTGPRSGWFEFDDAIGADHRRMGYAAESVLLLRFMFAERRYLIKVRCSRVEAACR